jgi:C-terminal processing protease CtpA/Prc
VGDTTGGASGRPVTRELPNGWTYTLSTWVEYETNGQVFENIGIAPDVYVPSRMADVATGVDPVIEKAIELVGAKK